MTNAMVLFDPSAPAGSRFMSTAVREEIGEVAPRTIDPGTVTGSKLAANTVTGDKIAPGTIDSSNIGTGQVATANLAANSVTAAKLAAASLTLASVGPGVMGIEDADNNPITVTAMVVSAAVFAGLTPDPNTLYLITA